MSNLGSQAEDAVRVLLSYIKPGWHNDQDLRDTPARVRRALVEMTSGYDESPGDILKATFLSDIYDEMVVLRGIRFSSLCEHHLLPFIGSATVGYIPDGKIVGISKLARLVSCYARRLQVQEKLTVEIADSLMEHLRPLGAGVILTAHHECMGCRGVHQPDAVMTTSSLLGVFRDDQRTRAEFLKLGGSDATS
jgi:GTP cyclohydrolase IA